MPSVPCRTIARRAVRARATGFAAISLVALSACLLEETPGFGDRPVELHVVVDTAQGLPLPLTNGSCVGTLWLEVTREDGATVARDTLTFDHAPSPPEFGGDCHTFVKTTEKVGDGQYDVAFSVGIGPGASTPVWSTTCSFTHVEKVDIVLYGRYGVAGCVRVTD